MATIRDIAEKLGISIGTVSKGLNGGTDISETLRHRILETAVELGYENGRTKKAEHRTLAVFIENMDYEAEDSFGYGIVLGFRKAARRQGWGVTVIPVTPEFQQEHRYESVMLQNQCTGAFLIGFSLSDPWMEQLRSSSVPTMLLDNAVPVNPMIGCVGTDSDEGFDMAVSHLAALRHEKIAFLDGSTGSMISDRRMAAYLHSMARYGLRIDPQLAVYGYFVADAARHHVPGFLSRGATAILCGNDLIAKGVIDCCHALGYSVPEDVSVIGFDDLPIAEKLDPPLTTIRQNRVELGKSACYTLQAMTDHVPVSMNLLRPVFIDRASCAIAKPRLAEPCENDPDSVLYRNPDLYQRYSH